MTVENLKALESLNEFRLTDAEEHKAMEIFGFMANEAAELQGASTPPFNGDRVALPVFPFLVRVNGSGANDFAFPCCHRQQGFWLVRQL